MKICFVVSTYPRNEQDPAVPWLREYLRRLKDRGYDVRVFAPAFLGSPHHEIDGIPVHRFRYFAAGKEDLTHDAGAPTKIRRPGYLLLAIFYILCGAFGLARLHRRERFDAIHVHWPFPHGLFGILATRLLPTRLVLSFHGAELLLARKFSFVNPVLRYCLRHADSVTCNSSYTASHIRALGTGTTVDVLPYGSPLPQRTPVHHHRPEKTILFVGRLIERKGVEYLLRAMPQVTQRIDASLVIVGNGPLLPELRDRAAELGIAHCVEFRTDVPEDELMTAYEESDIFVLPAIVDSRGDTEGLGVVLIEALSFHRPVVASAVGGITDVVLHNKTGLLVPEKNPDALADAIVEVLSDPTRAQKLAEQGYAHVSETFDWDRIMDRAELLYPTVTTSRMPETSRHPSRVDNSAGLGVAKDTL
ncbi:MAG: glycosyltransferase family 4 protein [Capsulimonadales bacterium]|nr:glycosyltransferase family 4 protein [Capsulimonadales bacterium]